jgi:HAD superfamily hydrolase (TIGR01549 family)
MGAGSNALRAPQAAASEVERVGTVKVVLADFERTLVRMFEDGSIEQRFSNEVWELCRRFGVPARVLRAAGASPYSRWMRAHRWMKRKHKNVLHTENMYHAVTRIAIKYEMEAAEHIRLFDDVLPILERLKITGIPVAIVSNNATAAVERVLEKHDAKRLVDHIIGREFHHDMIGILKPEPNLLVEALKRSNHDAGKALLVGDSIDDMRAGRAARIRFRVGVLQHSTASRWQLRRAGANRILNRFGDLQDNEEVQRLLHGGDPAGDR